MKTTTLDFALSIFALSIIVGLTSAATEVGSRCCSKPLLGSYHVLADLIMFLTCFGSLCALGCRAIAASGYLAAGKYDMRSATFTAWKLFNVLFEFGRGALLPLTTVVSRPLVNKLFGAKIGQDVAFAGKLFDPQFVTIEDEAIIGEGSVITPHVITSGRITLGPVTIGHGATIGVNAVVMSGVYVGDGAIVKPCTVVPPNVSIPSGTIWDGSKVVFRKKEVVTT